MDTIINNIDIWTSAQTLKTNGRGKNADKQRLHGINKLRELIIELAVHGKLVPQDTNDEPASILLKRISEEKVRLIEEGKIKTQKQLPEISVDEKPFELPNKWEWTRLDNISLINPRNVVDDDSPASFIPMSLITTSHTGEHGQEERIWGNIKQGFTHFADGDIGLAKITPCFENSKAVVFSNLINGIGAGTTELHIARPFRKTLFARYVLLYLKAPQFLLLGVTKMTGTAGQKRIPKDFFAENPFPLPPLAEQQRIVAKVDELMTLCDQLEQQQTDSNTVHQILVETLLSTLTNAADQDELESTWQRIANHFGTLFTTERSIDQLKQTILQLAVMGKLVPQNPEDEPASVLLEKIAKEKARFIEEGKIKKQKPLPEIAEDEKPFNLPVGWEFVRLGDIANRIGSGSTPRGGKSAYVESGIPFLRSQNVWNHGLELNAVAYIAEETHQKMSNTVVVPNDILLNITGASLGRCAVYPDGLGEANVSQHVTIIRPTDAETRFFLHLCILSPYTQSLVWARQVGMAREGLSKKVLELFEIPLPPLAEQHRIEAKVDELFAVCDSLKERLNDAQTTQISLADAIVEQAVA